MSNVRDLIRTVTSIVLVSVGGILVLGWTVEEILRLENLADRLDIVATLGDTSTLYGRLFTPEHNPLSEALLGLLPGVIVVGAAAWAGWRAWRGRRDGPSSRWRTGLALAVAGGAVAALGWVLVLVDTQPTYWTTSFYPEDARSDEGQPASSAPDWATWDDVAHYRRVIADASEDVSNESWWTRYTPPGPSVPRGRPEFLLDRFFWENDLDLSALQRPLPGDTAAADSTMPGNAPSNAPPLRITMRAGVQSVLDDRARQVVTGFVRSLHRGEWLQALARCNQNAVQKTLWSYLHDRHDARTRIGRPAALRAMRSVALQVGGVVPESVPWEQVTALDLRYAAPIATATSGDGPSTVVIIDGVLQSGTTEQADLTGQAGTAGSPIGTIRIVYAPSRAAIHGATAL